MTRIFEYLEIAGESAEPAYRCLKCGHVLGPAKADYKDFAKNRTVPIWKNEPSHLSSFSRNSGTFVMKEYYCPQCAVMFEVDVVQNNEPQIRSVEIKIT